MRTQKSLFLFLLSTLSLLFTIEAMAQKSFYADYWVVQKHCAGPVEEDMSCTSPDFNYNNFIEITEDRSILALDGTLGVVPKDAIKFVELSASRIEMTYPGHKLELGRLPLEHFQYHRDAVTKQSAAYRATLAKILNHRLDLQAVRITTRDFSVPNPKPTSVETVPDDGVTAQSLRFLPNGKVKMNESVVTNYYAEYLSNGLSTTKTIFVPKAVAKGMRSSTMLDMGEVKIEGDFVTFTRTDEVLVVDGQGELKRDSEGSSLIEKLITTTREYSLGD